LPKRKRRMRTSVAREKRHLTNDQLTPQKALNEG
jgi:hypothetical protein